jgi:hypothetical protein
MSVWDIVSFIVIVLALIAIIYLLRRNEKGTKNKHKLSAYRLLDEPNPSRKEIISTIRLLRLYSGTFRKDKEFIELANRLRDRLEKEEY